MDSVVFSQFTERLIDCDRLPFPMTARLIRLAQYSCSHHSNNLRLTSLPTGPPSPSGLSVLFSMPSSSNFFLAASVKLSTFPVPNFLHGCPGRLSVLSIWYILRSSFCRLRLFSESTAYISREVRLAVKSGEWKKAARRGRPAAS